MTAKKSSYRDTIQCSIVVSQPAQKLGGGAKNLGGPKCLLSGDPILFIKTPLKAQNDYIF